MPSTPSKADKQQSFIDWLQGELDKRNWNRQKLADETGVYPSVIAKVMNANGYIGSDLAKRIADTMGIGQVEFFRRAGLIDEELMSDDLATIEILRLLAQIEDDNERDIAMDNIETILRRAVERDKARRVFGQRSAPGSRSKA